MRVPTTTSWLIIFTLALIAATLVTVQAYADTYQYDAFGRLTSVTYSSGSTTYTVTYTYDDAGNRTSVTTSP